MHIAAYINPVLGNNRETNNETTLAARQQIINKNELGQWGTVF
jgi:hypothetical protein